MDFTPEEARAVTGTAQAPVPDFDLKFIWHTGPWIKIFDLQIELIQRHIQRARAEDRLIVYLSCPISSRGGGYSGTNVDVARHVERALLEKWGEAFWILNPAQYQLESKAGRGLIDEHAKKLGIDLDQLKRFSMPVGGDYMRMWTKALVENGATVGDRDFTGLENTGQYFDAFYFIGPTDVQSFFLGQGETLTAGIQEYFARKVATDLEFRMKFDDPKVQWLPIESSDPDARAKRSLRTMWTAQRADFLRYYALRASANFSLGSHDEWLIFKKLNEKRRKATSSSAAYMADGDVSTQIAGFFDGGQVDPSSSEQGLSRGYAA